MSFLNALASGGLSVGLRIYNSRLNESAELRKQESLAPIEEETAPPPKAADSVPKKAKTRPEEQSPEERAAGRAEAGVMLASDACLGRLKAADEEAADKSGDPKNDEEKEEGAAPGGQNLDEEEKQQIEELKRRDREVKAHEQAHIAASAGLAGAPSYDYQTGPDGKRYAIGGNVSLRSSGSSDPATALRDAETIKRAATAPADPSSTDRAVAARASADINRLKAEKAAQKREESGNGPVGEDEGGEEQATVAPCNGESPARRASGAYQAAKLSYASTNARPLLAKA